MDTDIAPATEDWEPIRPARPRRRWPFVLLGVAVVLLIGGGVAGAWVARRINPPGPPGEAITVIVAPGSTTTEIAELLEEKGVISDASVFRWYLRFRGSGSFQAGQYTLRLNDDMGSVRSQLSDGPEIKLIRFTVPEGFTLQQIAQHVQDRLPGRSAQRFLDLANSGQVRSKFQPEGSTNLEGLLLPDTYFLNEDDDELAILQRLVSEFDRVATELGYDRAQETVGLTPYEAIVVASLVEEEAKVPGDRAKVSRVVYNRIAKGMKLEIDATVIYALGKHKQGLTRSDLQIDSPYNTRRFPGLPPTPIAAPGRLALDATLNPADGPWLFYVLIDEDGTHAFSESYEEFLRNKAEAERKGLL